MSWGEAINTIVALVGICITALIGYFALDKEKRAELLGFLQSARAVVTRMALRIAMWVAIVNSCFGFLHFVASTGQPGRIEIALLFAHFFNLVAWPLIVGTAKIMEAAAARAATRDAELDERLRQLSPTQQLAPTNQALPVATDTSPR